MADLLLDTHVLLFAFADVERIGPSAQSLILSPTNSVFFSAASTWEVAIKNMKHPDTMPFTVNDFLGLCEKAGYKELPVKSEQLRQLPHIDSDPDKPIHEDPFDRLIICQSIQQNMLLLTQDTKMLAYSFGNIIDSRC